MSSPAPAPMPDPNDYIVDLTPRLNPNTGMPFFDDLLRTLALNEWRPDTNSKAN